MAFSSDQPRVHSLDETQVAGYRRISVAAVFAVILGAASALALAHPLLWTLPAVAVIVALVALRAIHTEGSNLTGHNLAAMGLALGLLFGLWAPSRVLSRQWHLQTQARQFAEEWLELVRAGDLHQAHEFTLRHIERQKPGINLEAFYANSEPAGKQYELFLSTNPMKRMAALKDQATYEFAGFRGIDLEHATEHITLTYRMRYEENGKERSQPIAITLDRDRLERSRDFLWRVRTVSDPTRT